MVVRSARTGWVGMLFVMLIPSGLLTLAGAATVVLIWRFWPSVERYAQQDWAKPAVALCRFFLALVALFSKESLAGTPQGQVDWWWVATLCTVVTGWLFWEVADWSAAKKAKRSKASTEEAYRQAIDDLKQENLALKAELERADRVAFFRARLLTVLRWLVNTKTQRVREELKSPTSPKAPIHRMRNALAPKRQMSLVLQQLLLFLYQQLPHAEQSTRQNFRACLYIASNGGLTPLDGLDLNTRKAHPFSSYRKHEGHFRLDNTTDPAHAVRCIRERRLLIVPDCATDPSFRYFSEEQRTYLKSLVAYPIIGFRETPSGEVLAAALVIDTDVPGHFKEEDRDPIERFMEEFAAHFILEDALQQLGGS